MSRLIDANNIRVKPQYMQDVMGIAMIRCEDLARILADAPTVEAYTKDEVIAMFKEIQLEIYERVAVPKDKTDKIAVALADGWCNSQRRDNKIIQEHIDALSRN